MKTQLAMLSFLLGLPLFSVAAFSSIHLPLPSPPNSHAAIQLPPRAWAQTAKPTVRVSAVLSGGASQAPASGAPFSASSSAVGVSVSKDRGDENGVVPHLLATKGGGQKVAGGDDQLPSPLALFKHLFGEVLMSPKVRDLYLLNLALHVLSAATAISLGWLRLVFPALMAVKFKVYFAWLIVLVVVLTEVCSAFLNGAIVNRLGGGAKGDRVISGQVVGLLVLAVTSIFVRLVLEVCNQIVPLFGTVVIPRVLKKISSKRKHVYWVEQMDMVLTVMINENLGFTQGRGRAIEYYLQKWGALPVRSVQVDTVFGKAALLLVLGVSLPLIVYGRSHHVRILVAVGYSVIVSIVTALQFLRPLAANVYATAAYRYTELGRNDVWTRFPALAPRAYRSTDTDTANQGNDKSK